ncbi:MAG: hypothetical protein KDA91_22375 [Planctomycetaceae bacterium]|nr:hypothetical protein [Planctomycetaceae bacterium]
MVRFLLTVAVCVSLTATPVQCDAGVGSLLRAAARKGWKAASEAAEAGLKRVGGKSVTGSAAARSAGHGAVRAVPNTFGRQVLVGTGREAVSAGSSASGVILSRLGVHAVGAVNKLSPSAASRVAEMSADLALSPHRAGWLRLLRDFGDEAADFLWQNKGSVAVAATATAVVLSPEDFLAATGRVAETVVETTGTNVVEPMVTGAVNHIATPLIREAAAQFPWTLLCNMALIAVITVAWWWYRRR